MQSKDATKTMARSGNFQLKSSLSSVHWCIDDIRFLDWICKNQLQFWFLKVLRFSFSPLLLKSLHVDKLPLEDKSRLHTLATSYLRAGNTVKTTGKFRTVLADKLVLQLAESIDHPSLLEVGVSDGSSALNLLQHKELFSRIKITDRHPHFYARKRGFSWFFYDANGNTHGSKWLGILIDPRSAGKTDVTGLARIESINPELVELYDIGQIEYFDIFDSVEPEKFTLIKCANLLNRVYFDVGQIKLAAKNMTRSLKLGGYIVISQNNAKYNDGEAVMVLQWDGEKLRLVEQLNDHELLPTFQ
jgi:hypothetical protein